MSGNNVIKLDGEEYTLRCDINVLEKIADKYGEVNKLIDSGISGVKDAAAWMINEHWYYIGEHKSITPDYIGAQLDMAGYTDVCKAVIAELGDCMRTKN